MRFEIEFTETRQLTVQINANSVAEACAVMLNGFSNRAIVGLKQISGSPTLILHNVALTNEEALPNGYVIARTSDGYAAHDRKDFAGQTYLYDGTVYAVQWTDHGGDGNVHIRRRFKTADAAGAFLRRKAEAFPRVQP